MSEIIEDRIARERWSNIVPVVSLGDLLKTRKNAQQPSRKRKKQVVATAPFMHFVNDVLEKTAAEHPTLDPMKVMGIVEKKWQALSTSDRNTFDNMSKQEVHCEVWFVILLLMLINCFCAV